ncbi:hypothetical protein AB0J86_22210 [Micromonospora sp. NPDC049559]|uniref:hypothetical protein n=1 Tax=Micromonospora sp. NPDC049559 TaxID=3155923 RepID=UPI00342A7C1B
MREPSVGVPVPSRERSRPLTVLAPSRGRSRLLTVLVAAALAVTGCSGGDRGAGPAPAPGASTTAAATPGALPSLTVPTPVATTPLAGPIRLTAGMTRPGTRLRFGQKAIVPIRQYHPWRGFTEGTLGIVVERLQHVPATRVEGNFDASSRELLNRSTAYYVKIVITNESGNPMSLDVPRLDGVTRDGRSTDTALHGGELPGCEERGSPEPFGHRGATWVTCELWVSSAARPIERVVYREAPYGDANPAFDDARFNQHYRLGLITWA